MPSRSAETMRTLPFLLTSLAAVGAFAQPSNDHFAQATPIQMAGRVAWVHASNVGATMEAGETLPSCGTAATTSVWWSITPRRTGTHKFEGSGPYLSPSLSIWSGDRLPLTEAGCQTGRDVSVTLQAGITYYVRAAGNNGGTANPITVGVQDQSPAAVLANDDLANAFDFGPIPGTFMAPGEGQTTREPNEQLSSCNAGSSADTTSAWWTVTPSESGLYRVETNYREGPTLSLWRGAAHPLTEMGCTTATNNIVDAELVAGVPYRIRLTGPNVTMTVRRAVRPVNDALANATPIGSLPASVEAPTTFSTLEPNEAGCRSGQATGSVWWSFVPPEDGVYQLSGGPSLWSGEAHPLTPVGCSPYESTTRVRLEVGKTYYISGTGSSPRWEYPAQFTLVSFPVPTNDALAQAATMPSENGQVTGTLINSSVEPGEAVPSCYSPDEGSVWWRFTAPKTARYRFHASTRRANGRYGTANVSLWLGTGYPLVEVGCHYPQGSSLYVTLTAGETYAVRVGGEAVSLFDALTVTYEEWTSTAADEDAALESDRLVAMGNGQVRLTVGQPQRVTLALYDVLGREVARLIERDLEGTVDVSVPNDLGRGVYIVRVVGEHFTRAITIVR